jgi:hypothetical protein
MCRSAQVAVLAPLVLASLALALWCCMQSAPDTNVDSAISAINTRHAVAAVRAIAKHYDAA